MNIGTHISGRWLFRTYFGHSDWCQVTSYTCSSTFDTNLFVYKVVSCIWDDLCTTILWPTCQCTNFDQKKIFGPLTYASYEIISLGKRKKHFQTINFSGQYIFFIIFIYKLYLIYLRKYCSGLLSHQYHPILFGFGNPSACLQCSPLSILSIFFTLGNISSFKVFSFIKLVLWIIT